jgi:hypothetical protein
MVSSTAPSPAKLLDYLMEYKESGDRHNVVSSSYVAFVYEMYVTIHEVWGRPTIASDGEQIDLGPHRTIPGSSD